MAQPFTKSWTIPSTNAEAAQVQQQIVDAIEQQGYKREAVFAVRLALDEALVNAVKHGNQNDPTKTVYIEFVIDQDHMVIQIEDQGEGFIPEELPDPPRKKTSADPMAAVSCSCELI